MNKIKLSLLLIICYSMLNAQERFEWEKVDSVDKSKNEIYALTKMFIGETWKSAQDVIQIDEKESGVILVKGSSILEFRFFGGDYIYIYNYSVSFRMKDKKYKLNIDQVYCESARMGTGSIITKIPPFDGDNCPETGTFSHPGLPKKRAIVMMNDLRNELQEIIDSYVKYISINSLMEDW